MAARTWILSGALAFGVATSALAQSGPTAAPTAEHKALQYFVGEWTTDGEFKQTAFGAGGRGGSTDSCTWFDGNLHVICRGEGRLPGGTKAHLGILSYDPARRAYTYYGIDGTGLTDLAVGKRTEKTWEFTTSPVDVNGKSYESRYTIVETSPTSYSFKWETAEKGTQKWTIVKDGKATKK